MSKISLEFDGLDELVKRIERIGASSRQVSEKALRETHSIVTGKVQTAIAKHRRTGKTESSIVKSPSIKWEGDVASVDVGFDISKGGLPSIFLMYGTPRMRRDMTLYSSIYGRATVSEVQRVQQDIFYSAIREAGR